MTVMPSNAINAAHPYTRSVVIVGGGPAGLMAAEQLLAAGCQVDLYDAMPSLGRKFLLAGIGGLNLTHSESQGPFRQRYGEAEGVLTPMLNTFSAAHLRAWAQALGVETFVGSSGRVFPCEMKAAPLLRRWLQRLRAAGLRVHTRQRWLGWSSSAPALVMTTTVRGEDTSPPIYKLRFDRVDGEHEVQTSCLILALGGGSWARLGSDGHWLPWLVERGVVVAPLLPANCGFEADWSPFLQQHGGAALKSIAISLPWLSTAEVAVSARKGECVLTHMGLEGSLIYALSQSIRERISTATDAIITIDLLADRPLARLVADLQRPRGKLTQTRHWQRAGLDGVKAALLRDHVTTEQLRDPRQLAALIKALPIRLLRARPLDEAISSAGGVCFSGLNDDLMLRDLPGVFCSGEMLDWEAPTGGYLLTACFATGRIAGLGALRYQDTALPHGVAAV